MQDVEMDENEMAEDPEYAIVRDGAIWVCVKDSLEGSHYRLATFAYKSWRGKAAKEISWRGTCASQLADLDKRSLWSFGHGACKRTYAVNVFPKIGFGQSIPGPQHDLAEIRI